jgi:hypothetical protein
MRLALCLLLAAPAAARQPHGPIAEIFVPHVNQPLDRIFFQAEGVATRIYSAIGVQLRWRTSSPSEAGCAKVVMRRIILVRLSWETPADYHPGAMAIAFPYNAAGTCLTVFVDRIEPMVNAAPITAASVLGHVLAHEIGHVLEGFTRHAESGLMRAHWSDSEMRALPHRLMEFSSQDIRLIMAGFE